MPLHPPKKIGHLALIVWACSPQKLPTPTFQFPTFTFNLFETPAINLSGPCVMLNQGWCLFEVSTYPSKYGMCCSADK